jgi:hypothetical protein
MAEINRDRSWCSLTDDEGIEWGVMDIVANRASAGTREQYPCGQPAVARIFRRYERILGTYEMRIVEERRYDFREGEDQWFKAAEWARQLSQTVPVNAVTNSGC